MTNYITKQFISELSLIQKFTGGGAILGSGLGLSRGIFGRIKINNEIKDLENKYNNSTDDMQKKYYMTKIQTLKNEIDDNYGTTKMARDAIIGGTIGGTIGYGTGRIIQGGKNLKSHFNTKSEINKYYKLAGDNANIYNSYIDEVNDIINKGDVDRYSLNKIKQQLESFKKLDTDPNFINLYNSGNLSTSKYGITLEKFYNDTKNLKTKFVDNLKSNNTKIPNHVKNELSEILKNYLN